MPLRWLYLDRSLRFRVYGLGFTVQGLWFEAQPSTLKLRVAEKVANW